MGACSDPGVTQYPTHFHPSSVNIKVVELKGHDQIAEVTLWPSFILWVKVNVRQRQPLPLDAYSNPMDTATFLSVFSTPRVKPSTYVIDEQLFDLNTGPGSYTDEVEGMSVFGFHPFAEHGIHVYKQFARPVDKDLDNAIVTVTVAYVHKNDYAGAYDKVDYWLGNRWQIACGRAGTTFLDNYGDYPVEDDSGDGETPPGEGEGGGEGELGEKDYSKIVTNYAILSDENDSRLTKSDILTGLSAYPFVESGLKRD